MNRILLVSDLDGTLLDTAQRISPENLEAIRRFREQGGIFTLATGRMEQSVIPFVQAMNLDVPVIVYNGARIYSPATGEVLYDRHLPLTQALWDQFLEQADDSIGIFLYRGGQVYTPYRNEIVEKHERKDRVPCHLLTDRTVFNDVTKVLLISDDLEKLKRYGQLVEDSGIANEMIYSEWNYLEVLPPDVSKGIALQELQRILNLEHAYTMAVGDNLNDLSMVRCANRGYAVENAHPDLKEAADELTVHHEQHAIAAIIQNYFHNKGANGHEYDLSGDGTDDGENGGQPD
ncbi:Cof-type HAD-IIB family hydrolase [Paenibacillus rigui]|uniref:Cof-type HAD-IIB family hydrolase n=1 Tax=Paenibacillus rigui TaxID=554312 RepID=UPI0015C673BF|nr:Cof-type HAD-IIB family hydrolase [Paenibacillus rigui]